MIDFPRDELSIGDAICTINPAHGQVMSVAAQQALMLKRLLIRAPGDAAVPADLAETFFTTLRPILETPQALAARLTSAFSRPPANAHPTWRAWCECELRCNDRQRAGPTCTGW